MRPRKLLGLVLQACLNGPPRESFNPDGVVMDDYSNDVSTSGVIAIDGNATDARFDSDGDIDWFRVELDHWTWYEFLVTPEAPGVRIDYELRFYNSEGVEYSGYRSDNEAKRIFAFEPGTWFVGVDYLQPFTGETDYQISAGLATTNPLEAAGEILMATGYYSGSVAPNDTDRITLKLAPNTLYFIDVLGADTVSDRSLADPFLQVRSSDGIQSISDDNSGNGRDSYVGFMSTWDATRNPWLIEVSGVEQSVGSYLLRIRANDDHVTGTHAQRAIQTPLGESRFIDGVIEVGDDIDWIRLPMLKGRTVAMTLNSFVGSDLIAGITDGGSGGWLTAGMPVGEQFSFTATETKDYFVVVRYPDNFPKVAAHYTINSEAFEPLNIGPATWYEQIFQPVFAAGAGTYTKNYSDLATLVDGSQIYSKYADFEVNGKVYAAGEVHSFDEPRPELNMPVGQHSIFYRRLANGAAVSNWTEQNQYINAVDAEPGFTGKINEQGGFLEKTEFTFAFAETAPDYLAGKTWGNGFSEVSFDQQVAILNAMREWSGPTGVEFTQVSYTDPAEVDILIYRTELGSDWILNSTDNDGSNFDFVLNVNESGFDTPAPGTRGFYELLSGIGKSMGAKDNPLLNREYSVFGTRYTDDIQHELFPSTPSPYDLYRATHFPREQYNYDNMFGLDWTHNRGDTTYSLSGDPFVKTISDFEGAHDFVDASGQSLSATIDLRPGRASFTGDWLNRTHTYFNDFRVSLLNGVGGSSNDYLSGNALANGLWGRESNDHLVGRGGDDHLFGGGGGDYYEYRIGDGSDTIYEDGLGGYDILSLWDVDQLDNVSEDLAFQRLGNDMVISLNLNGAYQESIETITIKNFANNASRIESLRLSNLQGDFGWVSLQSVFAQSNETARRFSVTSGSDAFGSIVAPV